MSDGEQGRRRELRGVEEPGLARGEGFTGDLWREIEPIYREILAHPFLQGLTDGDLERDRFRFYVVQDGLYLREFARCLSVVAAKSPDDDWIARFDRHAAVTLEVERALHESFYEELALDPEEVRKAPMAPTCNAYTSHLLATAWSRPFPEVLAALLPCYWIYREVGTSLLEAGSPDPLYRRWIDTYSGDEYAEMVDEVLDLGDRVGGAQDEVGRRAMADRFVVSSRYEWMFWEMGWRREGWPVG